MNASAGSMPRLLLAVTVAALVGDAAAPKAGTPAREGGRSR